MYILFCVIQI